ncbi:MAG: fatty acid desaturase [Pseudolabrys sp.]
MHPVAPPYQLNLLLTAVAFVVAGIQLAVAPIILASQSGLSADALAFAVLLLVPLTTPLSRALLHEAIHSRLARRKDWNVRFGRAIAISNGVAFDAMRLGHMTHHRFPRHSLDRADIIEPGKPWVTTASKFYLGLIGWLYVREILSSMVMLLPRRAIERIADFAMANDESAMLHGALRRGLDRRIARIRLDSVLVVVVYTAAFYLYGEWWPVLLASLALRGLIVSLQDNVAHYDTPAVLGAPAHNTQAGRLARILMLNQNLHGVHHDRPDLPWHVLPDAFRSRGEGYAGGYFTLLMRQFYGPRRADGTAIALPVQRAPIQRTEAALN